MAKIRNRCNQAPRLTQDTTWKSDKVKKRAKNRNRYNQEPHLTQDTNGRETTSQETSQTRAKRSALSQQVTTGHQQTDVHESITKLERAVDRGPSQIPTLKFLTPPAPTSPTPGHDSGNRMKILFNTFSTFYL